MLEARPRENGNNFAKNLVSSSGGTTIFVPPRIFKNMNYEYEKNDSEIVRFYSQDYEGKTYYHIRIFVRSFDRTTQKHIYVPTQKGVSFTLDEFPLFAQGVLSLRKIIEFKRIKSAIESDEKSKRNDDMVQDQQE